MLYILIMVGQTWTNPTQAEWLTAQIARFHGGQLGTKVYDVVPSILQAWFEVFPEPRITGEAAQTVYHQNKGCHAAKAQNFKEQKKCAWEMRAWKCGAAHTVSPTLYVYCY